MKGRQLDFMLLGEAIRGSAARFGEDYFKYCIEVLCKSFQMDLGFIARLEPTEKSAVTTVSVYGVEEGFLENFGFPILDTPCGEIYKQNQILCYPIQVQKEFPCCAILGELKVEGYLGIPIPDAEGLAAGHICLLGRTKVPAPSEIEELFLHSFASRTGSEFRRTDMEAELIHSKNKAEVANEAKSRFLANMSHELRTPLSAVLGYSQLLGLQKNLDQDSKSQIESINRNGKHLLTLINSVLDMSQIEMNYIKNEIQETNLAQLNKDVGSMFPSCEEQGQPCCKVALDPKLPESIHTDPSKVRQILANLLTNAFKYSNNSCVGYEVRLSSSGKNVEFIVSDKGPGISQDDIERIFLPFERANADTSTSVSGTGLGLSIAQNLASAIDAELTVKSELGQGSVFCLSVPISVPLPTSEDSTLDEQTPQAGQECILIADDNAESRDIVKEVLVPKGYQIIEAEDGKHAIEVCLAQRPNLILMDIRMPKLSGIQAAEKIRETLKSATPPIIALTGDLLSRDPKDAEMSIFDEVLLKPFELHELVAKVETHLTALSS